MIGPRPGFRESGNLVPVNQQESVYCEVTMSKRQAILESLLGAAELKGNQIIANSIRNDIVNISKSREGDGYQRLALAASEPRRPRCLAA